ncbi:MAG: hypothetical protein ACI9KS_002490 [Sulfitobacter sp.]|jgi:hypothetical protein
MNIDPLPLFYYCLICAALAGLTPRLIGVKSRMIFGGVVGLTAAFWMPEIQDRFAGFAGW